MKIIKHSGAIVEFNPEKLKNSLLKSGASSTVVANIMKSIQEQVYDGITTKQIYKMAFALLKKTANSHAARYNLREAIRALGPAGFFFEKYIARIFAYEQYSTVGNLILQGKCISHEIDVLIKKNDIISMVECKYHAGRETPSDVKIPMYILSRFNDLKDKKHPIFTLKDTVSGCWIVTNNRFTADAIAFAKCSDMQLLSWNYPENNNLKTKNDTQMLYPVSCLTTLTFGEKDRLLVLDVILVKEIINNSDTLEQIGLSPIRIKNVLKEASELCNYI